MKKIKGLYSHRFNSESYGEVMQLAERGRADAQFALAKMYEAGSSAVKQDFVSAYVLYYIADKKGMSDAKIRLRSLELTMPAELWHEAKDVIRNLDEQGSLKQQTKNK